MIAVVILAAGASARMGKPKLTLPLRGKPILERALSPYREADVDEIVVVLGSDADLLKNKIEFHRERVIYNRGFKAGMSSSLKLGLKAVAGEAEAVLIGLGDQPFLSTKTVQSLIDTYKESKAAVIVPVYRGQRGNPVLFERSLFPQIMKIEGDAGAKVVVRMNDSHVKEVIVEDAGVLTDIDTPEDYVRVASKKAGTTHVRIRESA